MALTRAMLKGMGLTEEQVDAIINEHTSITSALKEQVTEYKEQAEKLPGVEKELSDLKKEVSDNDWKGKYDREHEEFEKFKTDVTERETTEKVKEAYKKLLADCKVGDKHVGSIIRVTDFKDMKLKEDGTLEGVDSLKEKINSEWSGFITTEGTKGAEVNTPPAGGNGDNGGGSSRAKELAAKYHEDMYGKGKEN